MFGYKEIGWYVSESVQIKGPWNVMVLTNVGPNKWVKVDGFEGVDAAKEDITASIERYHDKV